MAELLTQAEFARRQGWSKSYVTKLKQLGRLVLRDGKVDVAASLARIAETADPNRDDVVRRNAERREGSDALPGADAERVGQSFAAARAVKERFLALRAKAEYEQMIGKLVEAEAVRRAAEDAGAWLRARLESLPDQLAAELSAESDPARCHALLSDAVHGLLVELAENLGRLADAGRDE